MRFSGLVISALAAVFALHVAARSSAAQFQPPSEKLIIRGQTASTWADGNTDVVQLEGPVTVEMDQATLTAQRAVIWIAPDPQSQVGARKVQVALVGEAKVQTPAATRSGERMIVTAAVAGKIQLVAAERVAQDASGSELYKLASAIRQPAETQPAETQPAVPVPGPGPEVVPPANPALPPATFPSATRPAGPPATAPAMQRDPVIMHFGNMETVRADDGTVAAVLTGGVTLLQHKTDPQTNVEDLLELQAERVVVFTPIKEEDLRNLSRLQQIRDIQDAVTGAYLEGDVRVVLTPGSNPSAEQRLEGRRVFYEFTTDRAILTDAVVHTVEPQAGIPIIMRARTVRQLSKGEYSARGVELTTSAFRVPSYAIAADRIYVRQDPPAEDEPGRVTFRSDNTTFRMFGLPVFWLPYASGSMTDGQAPVRTIILEHTKTFGTSVGAELGVFETLGMKTPRDIDAVARLEYHTDRGPAGGLAARYQGGFVTEITREPWNFEGDFRSYFVYDHGFDDIGRPIVDDDPNGSELRGRVLWEHQHFFPNDLQVQLRGGYVSDQRFLEQWFRREFDTGLPHDVSAYFKRQRETEAFTFLMQFQPNDLVTTADLLQEQFEIERLPELGYRRIGDSFGNDRFTFNSENTVTGLRFQETRASLAEQGFFPPGLSPGIPSLGQTGTTDDTVYRGDFRQEVTYPIDAGRLKVVPYAVGRYTGYTDSPRESSRQRLFGAVGARVNTAFWKTYDQVQDDLLDLHRLRHVIEPELHVFASGQTQDRNDVFIYDERVDAINDVQAVQLALRQRWQTYRGGPGRWRSVDFFTLNLEANFFANQPTEEELRPFGFRGLFFPSMPEVSVPRNSINADAMWRLSDNTVVLADAQWNADEERLATASVGLVAQRGERVTYFLGNRYIADLDSNITTFAFDYQLTPKYQLIFSQSYDFGLTENVESFVGVVRRFDTFLIMVKAVHNDVTDQSGIGFNIVPRGLGYGLDTDVLETTLNEQSGR